VFPQPQVLPHVVEPLDWWCACLHTNRIFHAASHTTTPTDALINGRWALEALHLHPTLLHSAQVCSYARARPTDISADCYGGLNAAGWSEVPLTSSMEVLPPEPLNSSGALLRPLSASTALLAPTRMSDPPPRMLMHSHSTVSVSGASSVRHSTTGYVRHAMPGRPAPPDSHARGSCQCASFSIVHDGSRRWGVGLVCLLALSRGGSSGTTLHVRSLG
jgi:hypothetical protein